MAKFVKDYLSPIICVLTLVAGMAYSSGIQSSRIESLEKVNADLKQDLANLSASVNNLSLAVAKLSQRLDDQGRGH